MTPTCEGSFDVHLRAGSRRLVDSFFCSLRMFSRRIPTKRIPSRRGHHLLHTFLGCEGPRLKRIPNNACIYSLAFCNYLRKYLIKGGVGGGWDDHQSREFAPNNDHPDIEFEKRHTSRFSFRARSCLDSPTRKFVEILHVQPD